VGSRAVLDAVVKRKIPSPRRKSKPRIPIVQLVVITNELSRLVTVTCYWKRIDTFSSTVPHKVSYVLSRSQYGTIIGTSHIKTIVSFLTGIGKRFFVKALCSSDVSVTQLIHILCFFTINVIFYKPREEKIERREIWKRGGREWIPPFPGSGNSLSRKAGTRREKWGGALSNWKTFPTGTWGKKFFFVVTRKVLPVTLTPLYFFFLWVCKRYWKYERSAWLDH
jgi:hypothetical protein